MNLFKSLIKKKYLVKRKTSLLSKKNYNYIKVFNQTQTEFPNYPYIGIRNTWFMCYRNIFTLNPVLKPDDLFYFFDHNLLLKDPENVTYDKAKNQFFKYKTKEIKKKKKNSKVISKDFLKLLPLKPENLYKPLPKLKFQSNFFENLTSENYKIRFNIFPINTLHIKYYQRRYGRIYKYSIFNHTLCLDTIQEIFDSILIIFRHNFRTTRMASKLYYKVLDQLASQKEDSYFFFLKLVKYIYPVYLPRNYDPYAKQNPYLKLLKFGDHLIFAIIFRAISFSINIIKTKKIKKKKIKSLAFYIVRYFNLFLKSRTKFAHFNLHDKGLQNAVLGNYYNYEYLEYEKRIKVHRKIDIDNYLAGIILTDAKRQEALDRYDANYQKFKMSLKLKTLAFRKPQLKRFSINQKNRIRFQTALDKRKKNKKFQPKRRKKRK